MTVFIVLAAFTVLRVVLIGLGATLLIRPVRECPACGRETIVVQQLWLDRILPAFELRWCPSCRWKGLARRRRRRPSNGIGIAA
ncbi:MAG: hypothetical protein GEU90_09485 [Gemmatimonas sp.]|nr:hypothetical protein [Gemmatimonas sp.]